VFLAFLTTFLIDSGYKTPIQSMDELFDSGMKLAYDLGQSFIFESGNKTELSVVRRMKANCPSFEVCVNWAKYYKNVSVLLSDSLFQVVYQNGGNVGVNGEPLLCGVDDGMFIKVQSVMLMFYGEPILKQINDIFRRLSEAGLYTFWFSEMVNRYKLTVPTIAIVNPLDEYYSFNLYHMQPAFYLLLISLGVSVFCFVIELFCYRLSNKRR
jgi:hypothetical protein